jgi:hypothetical protein
VGVCPFAVNKYYQMPCMLFNLKVTLHYRALHRDSLMAVWPMTDSLWPHWMMQWLLSKENRPKKLFSNFRVNVRGRSICKLQIVTEKKRMEIMTYKQHLFFIVISTQIQTLVPPFHKSLENCGVKFFAGVAISTGRPTRCSFSILVRPSENF